MKKEKMFTKWILISVLTALFMIPSQTAFAAWSVSYSNENFSRQQHSNKRHYKKSHKRHYKKSYFNGHNNHRRTKYFNGHKRHLHYTYPPLLSFGINLGHNRYVYEPPRTKVIYQDQMDNSLYQEFIIKIRNSTGGFTEILIKKYAGGYFGPQGEYYAEFPKVSQLKAMYVK